MLDKAEVETWLNEYGQAWVKGDPAAVAMLFSDDATYQETPFDVPMRGKDSIKAYWKNGAADAQEDVSFQYQLWAVAGNEAFAQWTADFLRIASGERVDLSGTFRLVFEKDSGRLQCVALQEWWHRRVRE